MAEKKPKNTRSSAEKLLELIEQLELTPLHKNILRDRWLDQVNYMSREARNTKKRYNDFRIFIIIGSAIVATLVSLNTQASVFPEWAKYVLTIVTVTISLMVTIASGIDQFFKFGDNWRHNRRFSELLKIEGWEFVSLIGPYSKFKDHDSAFPKFSENVEAILRADVDEFAKQGATDKNDPAPVPTDEVPTEVIIQPPLPKSVPIVFPGSQNVVVPKVIPPVTVAPKVIQPVAAPRVASPTPVPQTPRVIPPVNNTEGK
ncbi:DUF4231 domain-containing protein [Candidatus Chlorohelix sp.]|uniref:DUF4231 domain-containing protein n=1 Tax=Candidatus Chlorohelix sp. TaxID=3139201 RepID=UPI00305E7088